MTEENKFKAIDSEPLYNDGIGYVTLYDASHANESEEQRIWTVTTIGTLAYGNEQAKNPEALYKRLQELKHESLWEFIRDGFDYVDGGCGILTSMRGNSLYYEEGIAYDVDYTSHKQNIACFRIKVPIFVARQFMRHRSFSYLEMSRRYTKDSKVPFEFWFPKEIEVITRKSYKAKVMAEYEWNIKQGLHTQVASRFLPQTTYTEFYMMGEVEGLKNFFELRLSTHAQEEIREVAQGMMRLLNLYQPELAYKVTPML